MLISVGDPESVLYPVYYLKSVPIQKVIIRIINFIVIFTFVKITFPLLLAPINKYNLEKFLLIEAATQNSIKIPR